MTSTKVAPNAARANEEKSIHGGKDGPDPAGGRSTLAVAAKTHKVCNAATYAWREHFGQTEAADVAGFEVWN